MIPMNPFHARARPDPYPLYQYMRTVEPVHRSPAGFLILTRYDDCEAVLEGKDWSHDADRLLEPARGELEPVDPTVRLLRASILFQDAPRHQPHLRSLENVVRAGLKGAEARLRKTATGLIKLMHEKGGAADVVRDYAAPLPLVFLCDLIGVPAPERGQVQRWGRDLAAGLDPLEAGRGVVVAGAAATAMVEYMMGRLDHAAGGNGGGVIGQLMPRPKGLGTWELIADLTTLLVMGVETSAGLIGNGMLALLRNPSELSALRANPALINSALEELIRYDGPVHLTARATAIDTEIGGVKLKAGEQAIVLLAAADHDPARFSDPERLHLDRTENPHLGFGLGMHACFAAPLARIISRAAILSLLDGFAGLELDGQPEWNATVTMRTLKKLPVRWPS